MYPADLVMEVVEVSSPTKSFERAVQSVVREVLETFNGVDNLSAEERDGMFHSICCIDVLAIFLTGFGKSFSWLWKIGFTQ